MFVGEGPGKLAMETWGGSGSAQDLLHREQGHWGWLGPVTGQEGTLGDILLATSQGRDSEPFISKVGGAAGKHSSSD